jgi:uncharacterized membrane protein YuzA (DUF378 family)
MNIKYNETDKSIEIDDSLKKQYFYLNLIMVLNLFNAFARLYDANGKLLGFTEIIWAITGIASLIILFYLNIKKSSLKNIKTKNIKRLIEKTVFGRKRFSLLLNNGKKRDLIKLKTESDIIELKNMFLKIGIQTD